MKVMSTLRYSEGLGAQSKSKNISLSTLKEIRRALEI